MGKHRRFSLRRAGPIQLTATQQKALTALNLQGLAEFTRADYEQAAGVRKTHAYKDLATLVRAGLPEPRGKGRSSRYRFRGTPAGHPWRDGRGRKRQWTDERIEADLRAFCGHRDDWPRVREFDGAGLRSLYQAVVRYGGTERWATRLGLQRSI